MRRSVIGRLLLLFGSACLIIVVLTHIAEAFHLLPMMGWGLPNSAGHYLDLVSTILGCILLPLGFLAVIFSRRKSSN
jgi:formate hydrogenlyase subunit 3/multisubunit Na+/H+ antiporter MnhD subunit